MGIFRATKSVAGRMIDVRVDKWMSFSSLSEITDRSVQILKDLVIPQKATHPETFEEALTRLNLTEADLKQRQTEFSRLFFFFLSLATLIIAYGLYVAFVGNLISALIAFCIALYCLSHAFRFHFWLFQIKNRKLGCTLSEWFHSKIQEPAGD